MSAPPPVKSVGEKELASSKTRTHRQLPVLVLTSTAVLFLSLFMFYLLGHFYIPDTPCHSTSKSSVLKPPPEAEPICGEPNSMVPQEYTYPAARATSDLLLRKSFLDFIQSKESLNHFNRLYLLPLVKSLVRMDYFRYVKVNLNRPCKLWCNAHKCNRPDCGVKPLLDPSKCPPLANANNGDTEIQPDSEKQLIQTNSNDADELSLVNTELDSGQLDLLIKLFECNEQDDHKSEYVDLLLNPERFTGYSGESANRIWRAIYEENCFLGPPKSHSPPFSTNLCYEERLFYEAISGLHSSINIHLCAEYPSPNGDLFSTFEPNLDEFLARFEGHNDYLENLYTLFQLELRALALSKPYLLKRVKWPEPSTRDAVQGLLKSLDKIDLLTFKYLSLKPSHVSHELATRFRNITTTIIDCVSCDKCKLWGKVQLRGLGTAFKILSYKDLRMMNLDHQEIVSLVNAIARLSHSVRQLETFRDLYLARQQSKDAVNRVKTIRNRDEENVEARRAG